MALGFVLHSAGVLAPGVSSLSELLTLRRIENEREAIRKWDGRLPTTTGGAVPFINLTEK